jgi:putative DNA primase/helicase
MADAAEMFEPLSDDEREMVPARASAAPTLGGWEVVSPVPDDAPTKMPPHRLGKPSGKWAYRNETGDLLFFVCRFDKADGGKEILPQTLCQDAQGNREWRWRGYPPLRPLYGLDRLSERPDAPILIVEGEKTADVALAHFPDHVAITSPGGSKAVDKAAWTPSKGRHVVVWPDNDEPGWEYAETVSRLCMDSGAASVAMVPVPTDFPSKWDLADDLPEGWTPERLRELLDAARQVEPKDTRRLRAVDIGDFLSMEIAPREMILAPVLPTQGLAMLYAARGVGKTFVGLGMAYAVATGGAFCRWQAPEPRRVLYVDGEMPASAMQERLAQIVQGSEKVPPDDDYLRIVTPDLQEDGIPDISSTEGQAAIEDYLGGVSLVVLDNLSTLCRHGRENEAESWEPMQEWVLSLRRRGISVLLVHHAGKGGNQRGTSKREDCLDTVICLRQPPDYQAEEGARFEVHMEKARGVIGEDAKSFEARLEVRDGVAMWTTREIEDRELEHVIELVRAGDTVRDIAEETGISRSKVGRLRKRAQAEGKLP